MTTHTLPSATTTTTPRSLELLAAGAIAATVPYAALKVAWLCGSRIGLRDNSFGHNTTMQIANLATLGLDLAGAALALTFASERGRRAPAALVTFPMWVGYGLLGEILVLMPLTFLGGTVGSRPSDGGGPIEDWVYACVYAGFTGLGLCLLPAFAIYAWRRWADSLRLRERVSRQRDPLAKTAGISAVVLAAGSLVAARFVSADAGRWLVVDALVALLGAGGLHALTTGWPRIRRGVAVAAAFTGTGALFAWGSFQTVIGVVPNDLTGGQRTPLVLVGYAVARLAVGALGGIALSRKLTRDPLAAETA